MLHLYEISTGKLISSATIIDVVPDGMSVKESNKTGVWNSSILDFDQVIKNKSLSRDDFIDLFTDEEVLSIIQNSSSDTTVKNFLNILKLRGRIKLFSENTINAINYMESKGFIDVGRAEAILNG